MRVAKLAGSITTTANGVVSLTMLRQGRIKGVYWSGSVDAVADNASYIIEVSKSNVDEIGTNDPPGNAFSQVAQHTNLVTSGMYPGAVPHVYHPVDVPYQTGDRIYLNAECSGTIAVAAACFLWLDE